VLAGASWDTGSAGASGAGALAHPDTSRIAEENNRLRIADPPMAGKFAAP
jgi:hypothetical protein